jgi:hypothetical protein
MCNSYNQAAQYHILGLQVGVFTFVLTDLEPATFRLVA